MTEGTLRLQEGRRGAGDLREGQGLKCRPVANVHLHQAVPDLPLPSGVELVYLGPPYPLHGL